MNDKEKAEALLLEFAEKLQLSPPAFERWLREAVRENPSGFAVALSWAFAARYGRK